MIYLLQIEDHKFVKIGYTQSQDVSRRIAELQTGCPYKIYPVMTVEGSLTEEKELHAVLGDALSRINLPAPPNEWYPGRHPFMRMVISELRFGARTASAFVSAYIDTKRGGEHQVNKNVVGWDRGRPPGVKKATTYEDLQAAVNKSLPNGSISSLLNKRREKQQKVAEIMKRQKQALGKQSPTT